MAKAIKRVYPVSEIAHLWAAHNRGDNDLEYARSGGDYDGARYTAAIYYSEGSWCAQQRTAKTGAKYVIVHPARRHTGYVSAACGEGNGRVIMLPGHRWSFPAFGSAIETRPAAGDALNPTNEAHTVDHIVRALIRHGTNGEYWAHARWLATNEALDFWRLASEVLDEKDTAIASAEAYRINRANAISERKARNAREAAEKAANDKNPLIRALRGVGAAAQCAHREATELWTRVFGWTACLSWLDNLPLDRDISYRRPPVTLLRVKGAEIHTTQGAAFPAEHGLRAWPFILRAFQRRQEWTPDATSGAALGHYRINRVDADGTVTAGCHTVPFWSVAYAWHRLQGHDHERAMGAAHITVNNRAAT